MMAFSFIILQLHLHCFYRHEKLDMASKLYILEIIELRKNKWVLDGTLAEYYRQKRASLEVNKCDGVCMYIEITIPSDSPSE